jgi:protein CpxP
MKKAPIIFTLLIGILLFSGTAFAWPGGHGNKCCDDNYGNRTAGMTYEQHEERMKNRMEKMGIILDLTEQQKNQLKDLFAKKWQERQPLRAKLQESRDELHKYKFGEKFNEAEFRIKAQKHAELKTEMMVNHAKIKQLICTILTPEQRQKAEKLRNLQGEGFYGKHRGDRDCDDRHGNKRGYGKRFNN